MFELLIWLIPLIFSGIILMIGSLSKRLTKVLSFCVMIFCLFSSVQLIVLSKEVTYPWVQELGLNFKILIDEYSSIFSIVVSMVGTLILIYSISYIKEGITRYYSLFLLFIGSMIGFVLAGNLFQIFIFWELMSVCSYLLIGFWYKRDKATNAGLKAMLTTKIGDLCLFLAVLLFFLSTGSFDLSIVFLSQFKGIISILLVFAILTKSAQFPFYFWLADAMEGPSTVSALLHSATMVASGAFLLLRVIPILTPESLFLLMSCSIISLVLTGFLALTNHDIKRILAFSTVSQLAFMILSISSLNLSSGFLHMINHAFFKSLLFLCTGIIIHYSGTKDVRKIGVAQKYVPILFMTFSIGILSLAGIPPMSGFWSKELMLASSLQMNNFLFIIFALGSFLTILYSFRLFSKIFGRREVKEHFGFIQFSVLILALVSIVLGITEIFTTELHLWAFLLSIGLIVVTTGISYIFFFKHFYTLHAPLLLDKFFRNEFYLNDLFLWLSNGSLRIAQKVYVEFENAITSTLETMISKTVTWFSKNAYIILELDFTRIEEKTLDLVSKKVYKFTKHSQSSYLNYNVLAVLVGIIILLFLVVML